MVTIQIPVAFIGATLIRGRCLFQYGYPKVRLSFEALRLLEEIWYCTANIIYQVEEPINRCSKNSSSKKVCKMKNSVQVAVRYFEKGFIILWNNSEDFRVKQKIIYVSNKISALIKRNVLTKNEKWRSFHRKLAFTSKTHSAGTKQKMKMVSN